MQLKNAKVILDSASMMYWACSVERWSEQTLNIRLWLVFACLFTLYKIPMGSSNVSVLKFLVVLTVKKKIVFRPYIGCLNIGHGRCLQSSADLAETEWKGVIIVCCCYSAMTFLPADGSNRSVLSFLARGKSMSIILEFLSEQGAVEN